MTDKHESSSEFTQILKELKANNGLITKVELIDDRQKGILKRQEKIDEHIENIYEKKASKTDVATVAGDLKEHKKGHSSWIIPLVCSFISGGFVLLVAYLTLKG